MKNGEKAGEATGQRPGAERSPRWIDRPGELLRAVGEIHAGPLAVDTEADSFHHYHEKVCLIQLSFGEDDVLVDPLAGVDLAPLGAVLRDERVRKILHGADYDLRLLDRDCGFVVRGLFDTMIAARLLGERAFGLAALVEKHVGVRLDKSFQRADWSVRPLPPELVRYAAKDTRFLVELATRLAERLGQLGRTEWAEEEFQRLEQTRWEGDARDDGDAWLRVKGLRTLDRRRLAVVRELARVREATARRRDVPPFRVMRDEILVELARVAPQGTLDLERVRGLPRVWCAREAARELRETIRGALALDERAWPDLPQAPRRPRLSPEQDARVRRLCHERDQIAARLGIDPTVLAPRGSIVRLLASFDAGPPSAEPSELRRWQHELLAPALQGL